MTVEKIIEQIISKNPQVSRKELLERLEREKRETNGLISDATLLRKIAAEFGVEFPREQPLTLKLSIKDLLPSLNDVTIVARVIAVFPPKTFKGVKSGKIASLLVADQSGMLRVVLWNSKANLIESGELKVGQIIRFSRGYTREDHGGKVELHIGERSGIETNPEGVNAENYPTISKFSTKIGEITQAYKSKKVNLIGTVKELFSASTFKRQDSSSGKVMRFMLADETGEIPVVVWNEKVDELEKILEKGAYLRIVNGKVKKGMEGAVEIHVDANTYVEVFENAEEFVKIAELKEGLNIVNVEGEVAINPMLRDVKTSKGENVKLAIFELKDETGRIWVSAWRNHAELANKLKIGDRIAIKNAYVKRGFGDQLEISTKARTTISIRSSKGKTNNLST